MAYFEDYKILFKPHPMEYHYIYEMKEIKKLLAYNNFEIVPASNDLYELLAKTEILMAVYTSTIIEALYFGCKIYLLNLPGVEMMESLVNTNSVKLLEINEPPIF